MNTENNKLRDTEFELTLRDEKDKFMTELRALSEQTLGYPPEEAREAIKEIYRYKWALRIILSILFAYILLLFGGTIYGYKLFIDEIDKRVLKQVERMDNLNIAISYAQDNDWTNALYTIEEVWDQISNKKIKITKASGSFINLNTLWILTNSTRHKPYGSWDGEMLWKKLKQERTFRNEFLIGVKWSNDPVVNHNLATCFYKYEKHKDLMIGDGYSYLVKSFEKTEDTEQKINALLDLALIDYFSGDKESAQNKFFDVEKLDPENYSIRKFKLFTNELLGREFYKIIFHQAAHISEKTEIEIKKQFLKFLKEELESKEDSNKANAVDAKNRTTD